MDPAALGTARIGLDRIRLDHERDLGDGSLTRPTGRPRIRRLAAAALRRAAARLDPAPAGTGPTYAIGSSR